MIVDLENQGIISLYRNNHTPLTLAVVASSLIGLIHLGHYDHAAALMSESIVWLNSPQGHTFWCDMYSILESDDLNGLDFVAQTEEIIEKLTGIVNDGFLNNF